MLLLINGLTDDSLTPTRSVVEGYVQQVDHVATGGEAEAAGLDVRSCGDKQSVHSSQVSWSSAECLQVT